MHLSFKLKMFPFNSSLHIIILFGIFLNKLSHLERSLEQAFLKFIYFNFLEFKLILLSIFVFIDTLRFVKFNIVKFSQPSKMLYILLTKDKLKLVKSNIIRLLHPLNISCIL